MGALVVLVSENGDGSSAELLQVRSLSTWIFQNLHDIEIRSFRQFIAIFIQALKRSALRSHGINQLSPSVENGNGVIQAGGDPRKTVFSGVGKGLNNCWCGYVAI